MNPQTMSQPQLLGVSARISVLLDLMKYRLLMLVLVSTTLGYFLASGGVADAALLVYTLIGVFLVGGGANCLNQWRERDADCLMTRTANRPLPSGQISPTGALAFGLLISVCGFLELAILTNPLALALSVLSWASYLLVYTPLKRISSLNTWVGAVPGALPAVVGWAAVSGQLDPGAYALFAILFFWQLPHFFAISWLYREDYLKGGFKMISADDPEGTFTSYHALINSGLLMLASVSLYLVGASGLIYLLCAFLLGLVFMFSALDFYRERSVANARRLFRVSILYFPVLFAAIVLDQLI